MSAKHKTSGVFGLLFHLDIKFMAVSKEKLDDFSNLNAIFLMFFLGISARDLVIMLNNS
jgi:hypothetical protein